MWQQRQAKFYRLSYSWCTAQTLVHPTSTDAPLWTTQGMNSVQGSLQPRRHTFTSAVYRSFIIVYRLMSHKSKETKQLYQNLERENQDFKGRLCFFKLTKRIKRQSQGLNSTRLFNMWFPRSKVHEFAFVLFSKPQ